MRGFRRTTFAAILLGGVLVGCDFGSDQMTVTIRQDAIFRYSFSSDTVSAGTSLSLPSESLVSFAAPLTARGYALDQVESAKVVDGFVELIFPIDGLISFTNRAAVRVTSAQGSSAEIAIAEGLANAPAVDDAPLIPNPLVDVSAAIRGGSFGTQLVLAPNETMRPDTDHDIAVKLVFELVVALR